MAEWEEIVDPVDGPIHEVGGTSYLVYAPDSRYFRRVLYKIGDGLYQMAWKEVKGED